MKQNASIRLPKAAPRRSVRYERLAGGLVLSELDGQLRRGESPEMKNLIWRDGALNCRDGQVLLSEGRARGYALAERLFHGFLVAHIGAALCAFDPEQSPCEPLTLLEGIPENAGSFFTYDGSLYYKNRGGYYRIRPENGALAASAVEPYVPVTLVNADPASGAGDRYQPENRLSAGRRVWYNAAQGETLFQLPERAIDAVAAVELDGAALAAADYTVDLAAGTVTLAAAPPEQQTPENNRLRIHYEKADPTAYESVMSCRCAAAYGGTGALCVVLGGSSVQPNAYYWNGSHAAMDAGYFPLPQVQLAGDGGEPITGFGKQQSYLIVFKRDSLGRSGMQTAEIDGRLVPDLPFVPVNSTLGCDLPGTIRTVENNLVWAHSRRGVLRLLDSSAAYENNVAAVSRKVNGGRTPGLLADLACGEACAWNDGRRYGLAVNGRAWVWDYALSSAADPSWFYWTGIGGIAFAAEGERLFHLDAAGRLSEFRRVFADYGRAIEKVYRFAAETFGGFDRLKNVDSVLLEMRSDTNATATLSYLTDGGRRDDPTELRAWSWQLAPRSLGFRSLRGRGPGAVFRRRPGCRFVRSFSMRLTNDRVGQDLSVVSAQVFYHEQGRQR
ncbi:MAG: hypothetical protein K6G17_02980 [Oscillospiraceae bacterium]|nr:hypothetical protein [Oscillospiraceae bacterium]